jgi:hypothetical protein
VTAGSFVRSGGETHDRVGPCVHVCKKKHRGVAVRRLRFTRSRQSPNHAGDRGQNCTPHRSRVSNPEVMDRDELPVSRSRSPVGGNERLISGQLQTVRELIGSVITRAFTVTKPTGELMISGLPRKYRPGRTLLPNLVENGRGRLFVMSGYSERCSSRANKSANRGSERSGSRSGPAGSSQIRYGR